MAIQKTSTTSPLAPIIPMFWQQLKAELLRLWRTPSFLTSSLLVPVLLFSLFGLRKAGGLIDGVSADVYMLASFATFGTMSVMLNAFGMSIANERAQRVNVLMRATPLPASVYLLAKVATALLSGLAMELILSGFAVVIGGVQLSAAAWITLIVSLVLGALPIVSLGFVIGYLANPTSAAPIINISFLIFSFVSGIFIPLAQLPDILQNIAPYLPIYPLAQLARHAVGVQTGSIVGAVWLLILYGVLFLGLAIFAYRTDEQRSFG
jgi:ABC-2 type transport system permease protein